MAQENTENTEPTNVESAETQEVRGDETDVEKLVDAKVNAAISNHLTRFRTAFEKDLGKQFKGMLNDSVTPLQDTLHQFAERFTAQPEQQEPAENSQIELIQKKYEARVSELEAQVRSEREQRETEQRARAKEEERNALSKALSSAGITGHQQRAAIALLYVDEGRVIRDDTGDIKFQVPKAGYTDEVTLEEGINEWLKTEEGKVFLPPRGAAGSGNTASPAPSNRRGPRSKKEAQQIAKMQIAEALGVLPKGGSEGY